VACVVALACWAAAAAQIVLPWLAARLGIAGLPVDPPAQAMGAATWGLLGVAFGWAGLGAARKRRWSRPVMLTLAWSWLLGGALLLLLLPRALEAAVAVGGGSSPAELAPVVEAVLLGLGAWLLVLLPALFVIAFHDRDLRLTLQAADPGPSWTESCPPTVLGLSLSLAATAILSLPLAFRPVVPLFGHLVTGGPGLGLLAAGAAACAYLARATYRLRPAGWWGATLLTGLVGVSLLWTLGAVPPGEWAAALGYTGEQAALAGALLGGPSALATAGAALALGLGYMVAVRRHFSR
jgi:hypothetical protein